ncbi:hypothetical protein JCM17823_07450 [Halorubrum gandharaense]
MVRLLVGFLHYLRSPDRLVLHHASGFAVVRLPFATGRALAGDDCHSTIDWILNLDPVLGYKESG